MKARLILALLVLLPFGVVAGPSAGPLVVKSPHYTVTSWAGEDAGRSAANLMEALLERYNSLFLFDLSKVARPWNVTLYANKEDFDAALAGQLSAPAKDYIYLQYADAARSQLCAWVPAEGASVDEVKSLAYQGFLQFLWTYIPHPPAWIETGLATVFWNSRWDGKTLEPNPDLTYLEVLQQAWNDHGPDLLPLLTAQEGSLDAVAGRDLEAWGLAAFLLDSSDPTYSRLFGAVLTDLSPTATEQANAQAVVQRFQASKDFAVASADIQAFWKAKVGFRSLIERGQAQLKAKNLAGASASFQAALALRSKDDSALYYAGLAAYEVQDYTGADTYFSLAQSKNLNKGLLAYARGLTAFALKKNAEAKTWLTQANIEDETTYGKLTAPVLELIR